MIQRLIFVVAGMFFLFLLGSVIGETPITVNIRSCVLVLGGTLVSISLAFPMETIRGLIGSLREISRKEEKDPKALVEQMEILARVARMHGVKALEMEANKADNSFLRKGMELVADGYDRYEIRNIMEKEYELYSSRKESQMIILNTMARLSPVFGFLGTIVGLIDVLSNMGEPSEIGKGMAFALLTTFYGLLLANFLFLPLSKKMSELAKEEATILNVVLEAILDISESKNSKAVSYRLQSYLGLDQRPPSDGLSSPSRPEYLLARKIMQKPMIGR